MGCYNYNMLKKVALNQNTYNRLPSCDESTYYFIDNTLKDGEIKNVMNYLLPEEVEFIRLKIRKDSCTSK